MAETEQSINSSKNSGEPFKRDGDGISTPEEARAFLKEVLDDAVGKEDWKTVQGILILSDILGDKKNRLGESDTE